MELYWGTGTPISMLADYKGTNIVESGYPAGGQIGSVLLSEFLEPDEEIIVSVPWLYDDQPKVLNPNTLNLLATVGPKDMLNQYPNSDLNINRYPNIAERHLVRLASNANAAGINLKTPSSAPARVDLRLNVDGKGYQYYLISEDMFGDEEKHYFDSDLTMENVRLIRNTNYTATVGYVISSSPALSLPGTIILEILDPANGEVLGRYTFEKQYTLPVQPPITLSQHELDSANIQLVAQAEDGNDWEMVWMSNLNEVVAIGDTYEGLGSAIDGGKLVASCTDGYTEIPISLNRAVPTFELTEFTQSAVTIETDMNVAAGVQIEVVCTGEKQTREIIDWPIGERVCTLDLSNAKGLTVISVILGETRTVLGKRLL